jgi:alpha-L-rhamnosidase
VQGWEFDWTLRAGAQVLEQHKYMECRFVSLSFDGVAPKNFTLAAWKTHYPYYPEDSSFTSSNATLNAVFELSRYTLEAASLDTYTDSNTRERRPYEADGIIAG